ncbi:hypothetical protein LTR37_006080 [Vermiconidia calcicola]|uniref:Uncharacterized protein n=1 Tax=Vermiconidia calcicola TaxID=1690605 RepID=A0ACC3NJ67_9PEZI|nr:hypothetical protein LTR37_006080 [Vermiconidia calcicola]
MAAEPIRRSARLTTYDSNGREYLASSIGWSLNELQRWVTSPTVQPHLQLWYNLCVSGARRFNDAIEWINTGERGYFYNPLDLEEDLLLLCLGEGDGVDEQEPQSRLNEERAAYNDEKAVTGKWITQELWARTAWRIVQGNRGDEQAFEKHVREHPAACYAFVIDLLCLAFHSLAFRGRASLYEGLVNGASSLTKRTNDTGDDGENEAHQDVDNGNASSFSIALTASSSTETSDHSSATDFMDSDNQTPATSEVSADQDTDGKSAATLEQWVNSTSTTAEPGSGQIGHRAAARAIEATPGDDEWDEGTEATVGITKSKRSYSGSDLSGYETVRTLSHVMTNK